MSDWNEDKKQFKDWLGENKDFYPDEADISRLVDGMNVRIDAVKKPTVTSVWWYKYATAAAGENLLPGSSANLLSCHLATPYR